MKYQSLTKFALVVLLALALSACPGGSGSNTFGDAADGPVSITITSPVPGGTMETPDDTVTLAGTADSTSQVVSVSWTSDKGGEGKATGETSWQTEAITLAIGENTITVTAEDSNGATASRTLIIRREAEFPGSVTLTWEAPTTREDGSPLTDLAGYYIHYGRMSETYDYEIKVDNPGVMSYVVENLSSGTWYFVASAYDSAGLQSNFSNEISGDIP